MLLVGSFVPIGTAHVGSAPPEVVDWRLEAERFAWLERCAPEREGLHVRPVSDAAASGGEVLEVPGGLCDIYYGSLAFEDTWRPVGARYKLEDLPDLPDNTEIKVVMSFDDADFAWDQPGRFHIEEPQRDGAWHDVQIDGGTNPADYEGTVFFRYFGVQRDTLEWVHLHGATLTLDHWTFACGNMPPDRPAYEPPGFGPERNLFWTGASYTHTVPYSDMEDDPFANSLWVLIRDVAQSDTDTVVHAFSEEAAGRLEVIVNDDPSARCPASEARRSMPSITHVEAHDPDWEPILVRPAGDEHCIEDVWVDAPVTQPVLVGRCTFEAEVETGDMPRSLIGRAVWRIDGQEVAEATSEPFRATVDLHQVADPGQVEIDVCFEAVNDIHHGLMCSEPTTAIIA